MAHRLLASPAYSKGSHDSDDEIELIEMRQKHRADIGSAWRDLVVCGHKPQLRAFLLGAWPLRSFEHNAALDDFGSRSGREQETGAYIKQTSGPQGEPRNRCTLLQVLVVTRNLGLGITAMFTDQLLIGSVVFDINTNRLDARFVLSTGDIADRFTIIKGEPAPFRFCTSSFRWEMWLLNGNPSATKPTRWSGLIISKRQTGKRSALRCLQLALQLPGHATDPDALGWLLSSGPIRS